MTTTFCTAQDVLDRIGVYANATIAASTSIIERYIETAEGEIVSQTRINYLTEYSKINVSVKKELLLCTACHAATEIIKQDMSGYSTTAEATTIINVNDTIFQRTLKALKDLDTNKMRSVSI